MRKQTAVEYLIQELKLNESMYKSTKDILDKALAMEWEQIVDARLNGFKLSGEGWNAEVPFEGHSDSHISNEINNEQYYDQTYKGGGEQ